MTCPTGSALRDSDDARHRLACPDPLVGASDQRGHGTRQDDLSLHAAWTHYGFVGRATKTEVLHAHEIRPGIAPQQPSDEVVVEVLVDQEPHAVPDDDRRARSRERTPAGGNLASTSPLISAAAPRRRTTYSSTSLR